MADEQESEPPSAVLHTIELPAFDSRTGQLTLAAHHLISSPLSYAASFAPEYTLLLGPPPARPYQTPEPSEAAAPTSRRKRRRLAPTATEATPADWARTREEESRKSTTDRETEVHHAAIVDGLASAIEAVREGWRDAGGVGWAGDVVKSVEWVENEAHVGLEVDLVGLATQTAPDAIAEPLLLGPENDQQLVELRSLFCRIVCNTTNCWREVQTISLPLEEEAQPSPTSFSFVLPPSSAFLLSDFITWSDPSSGLSRLGRKHGGWDLLLLDPPWPNSSATRASAYETFDAYDLGKLNVKALLGDTPCLVAVWVTNRPKYRRLLTEQLFPAWGITSPAAEWYWVKIASAEGEPVWDLDSKHRRCYEGLVLGYYNPSRVPVPSLPAEKIFLSVPLSHSRKPVITDLLRPYLPTISVQRAPNVLELFARTTLVGLRGRATLEGEEESKRGLWCSVGNEAIKFNVLDQSGSSKAGAVKGWLKKSRAEAADDVAGVV